jgi:hypothetical protein
MHPEYPTQCVRLMQKLTCAALHASNPPVLLLCCFCTAHDPCLSLALFCFPPVQSDEPGIGASASTRKPAAPADSDPLNLLGLDDNLMATTPTASGLLNSLLAPTNPNGQQAPNGSLGSSSQAPLATNAVNKPVAVQVCVGCC